MAVNEEARARRLEWRAGVLSYDPDNHRKQLDAAVFLRVAKLARLVGDARPAFDAAMDALSADHYDRLAAWHRDGRGGDKPTLQDSTDPAVMLFRACRDRLAAALQDDDYRAAVNRCRLDDWDEPSDDDLLGVTA